MNRKLVLFAALSICLLTTSSLASGQTAEVFAFQAPDCQTTNSECTAFLQTVLPKLSGIGHVFHWSDIDKTTVDNNGIHINYQWPVITDFLNAYINSGFNWTSGCVNQNACKIMLIIQPETDGLGKGNVGYTPAYMYSPLYASDIGADTPQDMAACKEFPGTGSLPYSGTLNPGDAVIWNANECAVAARDNVKGSNVQCTGNNLSNTTGFPVVYEKPIITAYQAFLSAFSSAFNSSTGTYKSIGQYISYVRAGLSVGGENYPVCEEVNSKSDGPIVKPAWVPNTSIPAGILATPTAAQGNNGGFTFLSLNAGTTGTSLPNWNQTQGTRTTNDNGVMWENEGLLAPGTDAVSTWPGPNGQFGTTGQPNAFQDNGFLSHWANGVGGQGYISEMVQFLGGLHSTFSWDFATNFGPVHDISYADADAVLASVQGNDAVGFGMQSLSVQDPVTLAAGIFPTSREDWIANFTNYPAPSNVPVHHLQMNTPGTSYLAAGYDISSITGNTNTDVATITCPAMIDCSPFAGTGMWVYITGNSITGFDGPSAVACTGQGTGKNQCPQDTLTISSSVGGYWNGWHRVVRELLAGHDGVFRQAWNNSHRGIRVRLGLCV